LVGLVLRSAASAAAQLDSVTIGFSSFSGFYGPLWLAVEEAWVKNTDRPESRLRGPSPSAATARQRRNSLRDRLGKRRRDFARLGVKDQVIVALLSTKLGGGIFSKSEIKDPKISRAS
jgi:hypothetical protein